MKNPFRRKDSIQKFTEEHQKDLTRLISGYALYDEYGRVFFKQTFIKPMEVHPGDTLELHYKLELTHTQNDGVVHNVAHV